MKELKSIAIFCGSSEGNDINIIEQAEQLGATLAKTNITLVYGAAKIGIMGKIAQASIDNHDSNPLMIKSNRRKQYPDCFRYNLLKINLSLEILGNQ